jgi:2-methylisocitrate lyase-like PEP mutase family enzyme
MRDLADRRADFRRLHEGGCFVIPNPWDRGSAMFLERVGFRALATTSAGFAFSRGLPDTPTSLSRDEVLAHVADLVAATDLPVNADYQAGYGASADEVEESVARCVAAGVAGLSIEDASEGGGLFELPDAALRVRAARRAIDASGAGVLLTARAECHLVGHPDAFRESIRRLEAYAAEGADVLYAPGPVDPARVRELVRAVAPKPLNVLVGRAGPTVRELADAGVRRISVGSALARVAFSAFMTAARGIAEGEFSSFEGIATTRELSAIFNRR